MEPVAHEMVNVSGAGTDAQPGVRDIEVLVCGRGPTVVMIPSLGRGAEDFADLAQRVAGAGFTVLCPQPRGIGESTPPADGFSMSAQADDIAAVISELGDGGAAVVIGHAYGNRIARMTATDYPHLVDSVVLLACGGTVQPTADITDSLRAIFDVSLSDDEHLRHVERAFFAPGNDPSTWFDGWYGITAYFQGQATADQAVDHWWSAGAAPILVVQPNQDVLAPPANADAIVAAAPQRTTVSYIDGAGHALLPEQPSAVAEAVLGWLAARGLAGLGT